MHLFTEQFEMEAIEHIKKFSRIAQMEGLPVELGFSGGKDSIVCYSMCERSGIRVEKNFYYAFEDPDVVRFIREKYPDVTIRRKEKSYFQLIREKGFLPTSDIRYCCEYFKENTKNAQITGVRRQESAGRKKRKLFEMKGKKNARKYLDVFSENCRESGYAPLMLRPILHYRTEEIWDYIRRYGLPYPELYDQGQKRCGCMLCPMATLKSNLYCVKKYPNLLPSFYRNVALKTGLSWIYDKGKETEEDLSGDPYRFLLYWLSASFRPSKSDKLLIDNYLKNN